MKEFRPMLAAQCPDISELKFPVLGTPKLDGIRCLTVTPTIALFKDQQCSPVSRNLKPIPNEFIRMSMERGIRAGMDGELLAHANNEDWPRLPTFQSCSSNIMSHAGFPSFKYYVFDLCPTWIGGMRDPGYFARVKVLAQLHLPEWVMKVLPTIIPDIDALSAYEAACISQGYEGVIVRTADSPYKQGRSTLKEQWMVKIKRFQDSEAEVLEVVEQQTNNNEQVKNALGYSERSTHAAGLAPADTMGALRARDVASGVEFSCGTGFDDLQRSNIWTFRSTYVGALFKYKSQPHGALDAPRFPVFLGWRHREDL